MLLSLLSYTISLVFDIVLVFLTGDLNRGFVRGFSFVYCVEIPLLDLSVEFSEALVPPPEVESSAPLLETMELFIPVTDFMFYFYPTLGGFAAEPEFGFLLLRGYSSRCSRRRLVPMLII